VTLAGTYWRAGSPTTENEAETIRRLETLTGSLQPFDLVLGSIRTFPGERPVVYLGVEAHADLLETRRLLLSILGPDQHAEFHPHLTLAMRLPGERAREMVRALQSLTWTAQPLTVPIRELRLMLRGPQDRSWRAIHRLKLAER
jgi:2'-5' RNA ligase